MQRIILLVSILVLFCTSLTSAQITGPKVGEITGQMGSTFNERDGSTQKVIMGYGLHMKDFLQKIEQTPKPKENESDTELELAIKEGSQKIGSKTSTEIVAGSDIQDLYFDCDFGFFSAILACYNNHWVLKTSPDDWWNVIARNVAQHVDENGEKNKVRDFFVDHQGKKTIEIFLPGRLDQIEYDWLFEQFSKIHFRSKIVY